MFHEKNATRYCAGPAYCTGCAQQTFTVQNKPAAVAPKETITHHFFVSGIGQKKASCSQNLWRRENVKTGNPANIRKWIARFYCFRHLYSAGSACVLLTTICMSCHRYEQLYLLLINILLSSFQLFLHPSDQPLSEGEIIRSAVSASRGEAALSTPEA